MDYPDAVGFPPPLLGTKPYRLPVVAAGVGWLALDKPAGSLIDAHPWNQDSPSLVAGLRTQAEAGKPELAPFNIKVPYATHFLDHEASGIALIAANKGSRGQLRELIGSGQATFTFQLVARGAPAVKVLDCYYPIGEDPEIPRAAIAHKLGKKSNTVFRELARLNSLSLWEAETQFPRPGQVRVHAGCVGLNICGESLYAEVAEPMTAELKPKLRRPAAQNAVFTGLCLRLVRITLKTNESTTDIIAAPSKAWGALTRPFN